MDRFLNVKEVLEIVGISRMTLERKEKMGEFPKRIKITSRKIVWKESDIANWIRNNGKMNSNLNSHP